MRSDRSTRLGPGLPWKLFVALLYVASLTLLTYLAWKGRSYYLTPLIERPRHPDYWALKPGGSQGIVFGIVGASLMTLMLGYSLRRRSRLLRGWGALRYWLDLHILCGVFGPLLIVLHSSLKVQGLVALSFWSMVAVALSGGLGRYLYLQIPRAATGDQLSLKEVEAERERLSEALFENEVARPETLEELSELLSGEQQRRNLLSLLLLLPLDNWRLHRRLRSWARGVAPSGRGASHSWLETAWKKIQLERRLQILGELQAVFHYWHVVHKPFAIIMYLFMIVHIAVATMTGYVPGFGH